MPAAIGEPENSTHISNHNAREGHAIVQDSTVETRQHPISSVQMSQNIMGDDVDPADPLNIGRHRRQNVSQQQMKIDHPQGNKKKLKKYYIRQNRLIDQFLGAEDEERNAVEEDARYKPKIKFAIYASFSVNLFLFAIQLYAAISTGSLAVSCLLGRRLLDGIHSLTIL